MVPQGEKQEEILLKIKIQQGYNYHAEFICTGYH